LGQPVSYSPGKKFLLIILIVINGSALFSAPVKDTVVSYDSSQVKVVTPAKSREDKLFADKDLHYKHAEANEQGWFSRFIGWLADKIFGGANNETRSRINNGIMWVLVLGVVGIVIWLMTRSDFISFVRGKSKATEFNFTDLEEDIKGINFDDRIHLAIKDNNLRLAVRWYYLKELNLLNTKGWIEWQTFKTNIDYAGELHKASFLKAFVQISRIYDYVWYGQYGITTERFTEMETVFHEFEKEVNRV
jgi:hypothetical protein